MSQNPHPHRLVLSPNHIRFEQPSRSYTLAPAASLPASTSNSTPSLTDLTTNMSLAQSSFQHNAMAIPGLGGSIASAMPNGYPVPSAMDKPLLTAGTPQVPPGLASWAQQPSHIALPSTVLPSSIPSTTTNNEAELGSAFAPLRPTQSVSQFSVGIDAEEGELSEGQFENLYESDQPTNQMGSSMSVPIKANKSRPAQREDALGTEFYDDEEEGEISPAVAANVDRGRGRSRSYSPCLSPTEIANHSPRLRMQRATQNQAPNSAPRPLPTKPIATITAIPSALPGLEKITGSQPKGPLGGGPTNGTMAQRPALRPSTSFRSLQEAKKEAQKIILGLLPMGVKYDQYLQEGFDETVIKGLFGDLRLDTSKNKPLSPQTAAKQTSPTTTKFQPLLATQSGLEAPHGKEKEKAKSTPTSPIQPSGKSEERKDRIARLLALKAAKGPTVVSCTPLPSPLVMESGNRASAEGAKESTEAVPTSAAAPTPTSTRPRTDKDLLLQQKLAALEKNRQAQAQQLAQEKSKSGQDDDQDISPMTPVQPAQKPVGTPQDRASGVAAAANPPPSGPIPKLVQVVPPPTPAAEASTFPPTQPTQPIPELPVQPSPGHPSRPPNKRKRPVASDFVEYVTTVGPPKRQFGQMRHETSLIIDVTDDDESTDQEMDIDTDSPVDHPSSAMPTPHGVTGPSIRDFPPLSDRNGSQQRQVLNPTLMVKGKKGKKVVDLQEKEKAIQEMKRRIAEAEARCKAKPSASVGQQTPNEATACTPEPEPEQGLLVPMHATNLPPNRSISSPVPTTGRNATPASETSQNLSTSHPVTLSASPNTETKTQTMSLAESRHQIRQCKIRELKDNSNARRGRILSVELPQVDERLEEKRSRLEQLCEQQKMLEAELERDLAQKRLLTTELGDYVPSENPQALLSGSDVSSEEAPSAELGSTDPSLHRVFGVRNALPSPNLTAPEMEMVEKHEPSNEEVPAQPAHPAEEAAVVNGSPAEIQPLRDEPSPDREMAGAIVIGAPGHPTSTVDGGAHPFREANMTQSTSVNHQTEDTDVVMQEPDHMVKSRDDGEPHDGSEVYETAEGSEDSSESPVSTNPSDDVTGSVSHTEAPVPMPTPLISNAASQPGADSPEIEAEVVSREQQVAVHEEAATAPTQITSKRRSSFIPYQSPLHQFRAFRFHPDYQDTVAGGLKSLTYSHKIEPQKPLCPSELRGEACDEHCEFQHLRNMVAEDDQILVELGRAEDFGADKDRFIQGLRKVLHVFRDQNVRDFDTIARGIIDFRHQFIGDKTKVLSLPGVSI